MEPDEHSDSMTAAVKLSICIPTLNRAKFIGATLESICAQITKDCEVVILDSASTDNTKEVVSSFANRLDQIRYFEQNVNNGFDRDCNRVVELARGDYCWVMTDDDLLKPGAIPAVLDALGQDFSFIFVNVEARTFDMSKVVQARFLEFEEDRVYGHGESDRLFAELGNMLTYVGGIVIKRTIWCAREKERYYGSLFIHVGIIFQKPLPGKALVIAEPLISYRMGNAHTWSAKVFETFMIKWPALVSSLPLSASAKNKVCNDKPWSSFGQLMIFRARGLYSVSEYKRYIRPRLCSLREMLAPALVVLLPGALVNAACLVYYGLFKRSHGFRLQQMRESHYYYRNL